MPNTQLRKRLERAAGSTRMLTTVRDVLLGFVEAEQSHWTQRPTEPSSELKNTLLSYRAVLTLYADEPAEDFTPVRLRAVQILLCESGLCCASVNQRIGRLKRAFRWAAARTLLPSSILTSLETLPAVRPPEAPAHPPVGDVAEGIVLATIPYMADKQRGTNVAGDICRLMLFTGMRPGEAVAMRGEEIEGSRYMPSCHKNSWRGKVRTIQFGPQAQRVLMPYLTSRGRLFWTKQGNPMSVQSLGQLVRKACVRAGVSHWSPNQLRHTAATLCDSRAGLECAQELLGHSSSRQTEVYLSRTGQRSAEYVAEYA